MLYGVFQSRQHLIVCQGLPIVDEVTIKAFSWVVTMPAHKTSHVCFHSSINFAFNKLSVFKGVPSVSLNPHTVYLFGLNAHRFPINPFSQCNPTSHFSSRLATFTSAHNNCIFAIAFYLSVVTTAAYPSGVATAAYLSGVATAAYLSGVTTAAYLIGVATAAYLSGVATAAYPSGVTTAAYLSGVTTAAYLSGVTTAAYLSVVTTAAYLSGVTTAIAIIVIILRNLFKVFDASFE